MQRVARRVTLRDGPPLTITAYSYTVYPVSCCLR